MLCAADVSEVLYSIRLEKNLKNIALPLQKLMGGAINKAREAGEDLKQSLEEDIRRFNKLSARQGSRTYTKSREVSTSKWYKPWTWGKTKTVYRTYTESYSLACGAASTTPRRVCRHGSITAPSGVSRRWP